MWVEPICGAWAVLRAARGRERSRRWLLMRTAFCTPCTCVRERSRSAPVIRNITNGKTNSHPHHMAPVSNALTGGGGRDASDTTDATDADGVSHDAERVIWCITACTIISRIDMETECRVSVRYDGVRCILHPAVLLPALTPLHSPVILHQTNHAITEQYYSPTLK